MFQQGTLQIMNENKHQLLQAVTRIDSPNGGHVSKLWKGH